MPSKLTLPAISESAIELPYCSGSAVDLDLIAGRDPVHRTLEANDARDAELARHDSRMGKQAAALDDDGRGVGEQRDPPGIGVARDENFAAPQGLVAWIAHHSRAAADRP